MFFQDFRKNGIQSYHPSTLTPRSLLTRLSEQATQTHQATHTHTITTHDTAVVASDTLHQAPIRTLPIHNIILADTASGTASRNLFILLTKIRAR